VTVDWRAVAVGAAVAICLAVPPVLIYIVLHDADVIGDKSSLALIFYALAMIGFATGGFVAASKRPDTPLTHGALAAFAGFALVQAIGVAVIVLRGDTVHWVQIIFNALLSAGLGLLGGLVATRRAEAAQNR
jgi:putative membrane protein (TIGR04086 family)